MPNSIIVTSAYSKKEMDPKVFYIKGAIAAYYDVNNSNNLFQPFKQSDNYQAWENIVKQLNDLEEELVAPVLVQPWLPNSQEEF